MISRLRFLILILSLSALRPASGQDAAMERPSLVRVADLDPALVKAAQARWTEMLERAVEAIKEGRQFDIEQGIPHGAEVNLRLLPGYGGDGGDGAGGPGKPGTGYRRGAADPGATLVLCAGYS